MPFTKGSSLTSSFLTGEIAAGGGSGSDRSVFGLVACFLGTFLLISPRLEFFDGFNITLTFFFFFFRGASSKET